MRTFSVASTANLSAEQTIAALRSARPGMLEELRQLWPPFVVAIYKDGSLRKLDLE